MTEVKDPASPALSASQLIAEWREAGGPAGEIVARLDQAEASAADWSGIAQSLTAERDGLAAALETANEELEALRGAIAEKDAAMAKLQKKAKVAQAERKAGKLRDFSKVPALGGSADRAALAELIAGADRVELVLTREGKEASKLRPFEIAGNPWALGAAGLRLTLPLDLTGSFDAGPVAFDGYGLIVDGALVAHRARGDKASLAPGQQMRLVDDVIF